jgi:DNA-binding CsgD family transcriptional regulator
MALLERDTELAALTTALTDAADRQGSVVLIAGEPGIGKSTLVTAATSSVDDVRVLLGACDDFLTTRALGPLRDVARTTRGPLAEAVASTDTGAVLDAVLAELDNPLRPTVLILEDLHWADEATLDVVRYVGRRIADLPATMWLTYRDSEVGPQHPLSGVLGALPVSAVRRLQLPPLTMDAVRRMTEGRDLDPNAVMAATGGNPFFVTELAEAGSTQALPASVADAVTARVAQFDEPTRRALGLLSVMPGVIEHGALAAVLPDLTVLYAPERAGLLVTTVAGLRFRHELARQAIASALTSTQRLLYHREVLDRLLGLAEVDRTRLLHHAIEVGDDAVLVAHGPAAATEAFRADAHRQAVEIQSQLLRRADMLDAAVRAELLEQHVATLTSLHRFDGAEARAAEAVALRAELGDPVAEGRALLLQSRAHWSNNHAEDARSAATAARDLIVGAGDPEAEAELAVVDAFHALLFRPGFDAVRAAEQSLVAAEQVGRDDLRSLALNYRGCARATANMDGVEDDLEAAVAVGVRSGNFDVTGRAHLNLVRTYVMRRPDIDVRAKVERALAFMDDHDFASYRYYLTAHFGGYLLDGGEWDEAEELFSHLVRDVEHGGVFEAPARTGLARIALRRGDDDADRLVEQAWEVADRSRAPQYLAAARAMRIEHAWLADDAATVASFAEQVASSDAPAPYVAESLQYLRWAGMDVVVPERCPEPWASGLLGDWLRAAAGWHARRQPYEQALSRASSGNEDELLAALMILDGLGAVPAARLVRQQLRDLGVRSVPRGPRTSTRENPAGLTDRQLDVLSLLAEGLTNADIADRLVVSVRTVDHHVSAVLQKLGVDSRQEAAAQALDVLAGAGRGDGALAGPR